MVKELLGAAELRDSFCLDNRRSTGLASTEPTLKNAGEMLDFRANSNRLPPMRQSHGRSWGIQVGANAANRRYVFVMQTKRRSRRLMGGFFDGEGSPDCLDCPIGSNQATERGSARGIMENFDDSMDWLECAGG
jgi:hypothetical protein